MSPCGRARADEVDGILGWERRQAPLCASAICRVTPPGPTHPVAPMRRRPPDAPSARERLSLTAERGLRGDTLGRAVARPHTRPRERAPQRTGALAAAEGQPHQPSSAAGFTSDCGGLIRGHSELEPEATTRRSRLHLEQRTSVVFHFRTVPESPAPTPVRECGESAGVALAGESALPSWLLWPVVGRLPRRGYNCLGFTVTRHCRRIKR